VGTQGSIEADSIAVVVLAAAAAGFAAEVAAAAADQAYFPVVAFQSIAVAAAVVRSLIGPVGSQVQMPLVAEVGSWTLHPFAVELEVFALLGRSAGVADSAEEQELRAGRRKPSLLLCASVAAIEQAEQAAEVLLER